MCVYGDILSKYVCTFLCSAVHMCFQHFEPITFINFNLLLILTSHALPFPCLTLWQISAIPDMPYRHVRKEPSRCQGKDTHQLQINIFTFRWPLSCITGCPFLSLSLSLASSSSDSMNRRKPNQISSRYRHLFSQNLFCKSDSNSFLESLCLSICLSVTQNKEFGLKLHRSLIVNINIYVI